MNVLHERPQLRGATTRRLSMHGSSNVIQAETEPTTSIWSKHISSIGTGCFFGTTSLDTRTWRRSIADLSGECSIPTRMIESHIQKRRQTLLSGSPRLPEDTTGRPKALKRDRTDSAAFESFCVNKYLGFRPNRSKTRPARWLLARYWIKTSTMGCIMRAVVGSGYAE